MNTETTENIKGYIFYDDECPFCCTSIARSHRLMLAAGYHYVPMKAAWALNKLAVQNTSEITEMKLLTAKGELFGGVDAYIRITQAVWFLWPISILLRLPVVYQLSGYAYRKIARNRHCIAGVCGLTNRRQNPHGHVKRAFLEFMY